MVIPNYSSREAYEPITDGAPAFKIRTLDDSIGWLDVWRPSRCGRRRESAWTSRCAEAFWWNGCSESTRFLVILLRARTGSHLQATHQTTNKPMGPDAGTVNLSGADRGRADG